MGGNRAWKSSLEGSPSEKFHDFCSGEEPSIAVDRYLYVRIRYIRKLSPQDTDYAGAVLATWVNNLPTLYELSTIYLSEAIARISIVHSFNFVMNILLYHRPSDNADVRVWWIKFRFNTWMNTSYWLGQKKSNWRLQFVHPILNHLPSSGFCIFSVTRKACYHRFHWYATLEN